MAATRIFRFHRRRHLIGGIILLAFAVGMLENAIQAPLSGWDPSVGDKGLEIWDILFVPVFIWLGIRQLRMGVKVSGEKLTVRGAFRTRKVNVSDIRAITLQSDRGTWRPRVKLTNGNRFWIGSLDCGGADRPDPKLAARFDQFRVLLGVEAGGISTSGSHPNDLAGLPVPYDDEPLHDALLAQSQNGEPELNAHGLPVQDRRTTGLIYLGVTGCLVCAAVSAWLPIMALKYHSARNVPFWLVTLDFVAGGLACGLAWAVWAGAKKKQHQLGMVTRSILVAGAVIGAISVTIMLGIGGAQTNSS